ncbi:dihydrofolate reductase-like [Bacillus rossius redtenbacheri]|uniref:dihydrofolate reductase-like n=1 Tax=Bacillus rossius redtenbacheri TaxID=93214 RepID=UPI002FDDFABE
MSVARRKSVQLNVISAADQNMGIGRAEVLPWHIPSEFRYFLDMTSRSRRAGLRNAVIVGRKTWDTMERVATRPHPGALNVVLTKGAAGSLGHPDAFACPSLDLAVELLGGREDIDQAWVIGGTQAYRSALQSQHFHRLYLSRIEAVFPCDSFFPGEFNELSYRRVPDDEIGDDRVPLGQQTDEQTGIKYQVCVYERKSLQ